MATVANVEYNVMGAGPGGKWVFANVTMSNAYTVGGESITAASLGLKYFRAVFVGDSNEDGWQIDANYTDGGNTCTFKTWVFGSASTSAAQPFESKVQDLSAATFPILVRGI